MVFITELVDTSTNPEIHISQEHVTVMDGGGATLCYMRECWTCNADLGVSKTIIIINREKTQS